MGSVYAATDNQSGQRVAIKALTPQLAMAEGFRERFEAEIESLKTLRHDGIVRLFGYGEQDGMLFYSMELVDGTSLEDELKAGRRFSWREVSSIAIQLSLALKHAHDHGVIHRDIKPANILLFGEDHVKLADFGIARLFGNTSLTTAGGVLGTADYMSPEQAEGRPVTARCDQYSLGGVMYALLAGRPPFRAKNLPQMLQMQRFAKPEPVRRYAPDTPEQLERVIAQLLAKDPGDRFPNMQVLARHLQAMAMALTRPAADDFALSTDRAASTRAESELSQSMAADATQSEVHLTDSSAVLGNSHKEGTSFDARTSQNAATLAALEVSKHGSRPADEAKTAIEDKAGGLASRPTRFTTLEEEDARREAGLHKTWLVTFGQVSALIAVITALGGMAYYASRPASADTLHSSIVRQLDASDPASLGKVESDLNEFLMRYPNDPRAAELSTYKQKIELDKSDRRLQRQIKGRVVTDPTLLPIEQLYLRAADIAESSPEQAVKILEALVNLYGAEREKPVNSSSSVRTEEVVQLARHRIETLRTEIAKQHERFFSDLSERLQAAGRLAKKDPARAAAMYQAII